MNYLEITLIALALAVDATVYAFSYGLVLRQKRGRAALWLALTVGAFQAGMPLLGYWGGESLRAVVSSWAPWLVLVVFALLGGSIIYKAWLGEEEESVSASVLGFWGLILVGVATSIDALAVGACMALGNIGGPEIRLGEAVGLIGGITFACALSAFHSARLLHHLPTRWLETAAGLLLLGLGIQAVC
jgi:putative Mn2+ efflux pump MntP